MAKQLGLQPTGLGKRYDYMHIEKRMCIVIVIYLYKPAVIVRRRHHITDNIISKGEKSVVILLQTALTMLTMFFNGISAL